MTPRLRIPEAAPSLWLEGYEFISKRRRRFHSDAFRGRLFFEPVVFLGGRDGAEVFYDSDRFRREDAAPPFVLKTLFGETGVQTLDDERHRHRKSLFLPLMSTLATERLALALRGAWKRAAARWVGRASVSLIDESHLVLCEAACDLCGIALEPSEVDKLAVWCAAMIDGFASVGPRGLRALAARRLAEEWAERIIDGIRRGERAVEPGLSAERFALAATDGEGDPLPTSVAAVELLNVLRPIVAIGRFVAFAALALRDHPAYLEMLRADDLLFEPFVQEVRRFYPFTPFLAARARGDFVWRGVELREGELCVLDVYGTNHDPRIWIEPERFWPERFLGRDVGAFELLAQGGGDVATGHRCPGEVLTVVAMQESLRFLTREITYTLPAQDLSVSLRRIPARPASGVVMTDVRAAPVQLPIVVVSPRVDRNDLM
ncbi:MAG: cytochrome P450 [Sandaracinaceae bacterium]